MQEAFKKIIEKLSNLGWVFADYYPDGTNISRVSKKSVPYEDVMEVVKQAAAEFKKQCECKKPQTQADRIRAMTDEELSEFIVGLNERCLAGIGECDCRENKYCSEICEKKVIQWLQSEVEEWHER